jgi:carbonic anhydrase
VGKNQSPIDIQSKNIIEAELKPLEIHYDVNTTEIVNNGHTLQMNVEPGAYLMAEGKRFELLQFHMHSPSEHLVDGKSFPLELHFVHRSEEGEIAVIGVLFKQGDHHLSVGRIEDIAPQTGEAVPLKMELDELMTADEVESYYRYSGSLTTPPCTEGLRWYIWPSVVTVSKEQIDTYVDLIGFDARDAQPMNARFVLFADD